MRRNDQPSRPNAMTCSRFSLLKTWLMTTEANFPLRQLCLKPSLYGRFSLDHLWPLLGDHRGVLHRTLHGTRFVPQGAKLKRLLPASLIALVVIASVLWLLVQRHKTGTPAPAANIAWEWEATVKYDWGDTYHDWFNFEVDGRELSGTAGFLGTRKGQGLPIWDGKIAGDRINFTTKSPTSISGDDKTYEDKHYYKGTVKGDTIDFTMVTDS